jgi:hypothetical protein
MQGAGEIFEGGCLCGQLRYRFEGPVPDIAYCHCRLCRQSTGAPTYHIWRMSKRAWFETTDSLPRHDGRGRDSYY